MFQRKTIKMITEEIAIIPEASMLDSNLYVIGTDNLMLIDSGNGIATQQILNLIKSQFGTDEIQAITQTHYHIDHILGLYKFKKKFSDLKIYAHEIEARIIEAGDKKLINPMAGMFLGSFQRLMEPIAKMFGINPEPVEVDVKLKDGDIINWGSLSLKVIHTPGHTPGGICLYDKEKKILFTGDTVFTHGSFGRVDFPGGSAVLLQKSLKKLAELEVEILLPGHMGVVLKDGKKHLEIASSMWF